MLLLYMKLNVENFNHYGDILAIPFFALLTYYFYTIKYKTLVEYILFYFCISGTHHVARPSNVFSLITL